MVPSSGAASSTCFHRVEDLWRCHEETRQHWTKTYRQAQPLCCRKFTVGQRIALYDHHTCRWDRPAIIRQAAVQGLLRRGQGRNYKYIRTHLIVGAAPIDLPNATSMPPPSAAEGSRRQMIGSSNYLLCRVSDPTETFEPRRGSEI